jgi:hypothetical protein
LDFGLMTGIDPQADGNTDAHTAAPQDAGLPNAAADLKADTQLPAPPDPIAEASQSVALPKEITFALKLDPQMDSKNGGSVKESSKTALEVTNIKISAPTKTSAAAVAAVEEAHRAEPRRDPAASHTDALSRVVAFQTMPQNPPNPPSNGPEAAAPPRVEPAKALETAAIQTPTVDSTSKAAGPLKELSIQVGQTQQDRVQLRVVDRSGEVQVAVRASNPDVAQGLRQGLSDLVDRLQQNGFRTEAWRPGGSVTSVQGTGETRQKEMQFQRDGSQQQSGSQQQGRQQNPQNQTYRPRWVQELEGSLSDGSNFTPGDSNGITS